MAVDATTFEHWLRLFPDRQQGAWVRSEPITSRTPFIFSSLTAPLPAAAYFGGWQWFEGVRTLAGYHLHALLPRMFEIWLDRDRWDEETDLPIPARDLLDRAERAGTFPDDLPLMRELIAESEGLLDLAAIEMLDGLKRVASRFNDRWASTATWDLRIEVYADPMEAGEALHERGGEEGAQARRDWLDVCSRVDQDPAARETVTTRFLESDEF